MKATRAIVDQLIELFQQGRWEDLRPLFSSDSKIIQHFGSNVQAVSIDQLIESSAMSNIGNPTYINRRVNLFDNGFVEQHDTSLKIGDKEVILPVCIIIRVDDNGKICLFEEYLDPSILIKALKSLKK